MRAIDTNVLVRLITRDHPKQLRVAQDFVSGGAWVSPMVLMETLWVLESVYGINRTGIAATVEVLVDHRDLTLQDAAIVSAALVTFRKTRKVSFSDCLILESARKAAHLPMGTFDRRLSRAEGTQRLPSA